MWQLSKIILVLFVLQFTLMQSAEAQIRSRYYIGCVGNMGAVTKMYSGPVYIQGDKCIDVFNGVKTFTNSGDGMFSMACKETGVPELLQISAYPNPVTNFLTVKTLTKLPSSGNNEYQLRLMDFSGRVISVVKTNIASLDNGMKLSVGNLVNGYYSIAVYSATQLIQTVKIIKN